MTKENKLICTIYNRLAKPVCKMTVKERCDVQKMMHDALEVNLPESDRENFTHHVNNFESDIYIIVKRTEEAVSRQLATIGIAMTRIQGAFEEYFEEEKNDRL